jgi:3-oxoacyl-[acyl-carrier protein] reductase
MSMTLANELGIREITVNAVAPGATRTATNGPAFEAPGLADFITGTTALNRLGEPDDIADIVAFLAVIDASGGLSSARVPRSQGLPTTSSSPIRGGATPDTCEPR